MGKTIKVRWAFNPFSHHEETKLRDLEYIKLLKKTVPAQIIPTYVLGSEHTEWVGYVVKNQGSEAREAVLKECRHKLEELGARELVAEPEIITSDAISIRSDARAFAEKCADSDLVIVNSHARNKISEWLLGGFAETYLFKSKTPTIFIPPNEKPLTALGKVVYPTDLSISSRVVFDAFLKKPYLCAKEVKLYSNVVHPVTSFVSSSSLMFGGGLVSFDDYIAEDKAERVEEAKEWVGVANAHGFKADFTVEEGPITIADSITKFCREEECNMIAMPSFSKKLDSLLIGSTTREVLRKSEVPVLIWHMNRDDSRSTIE